MVWDVSYPHEPRVVWEGRVNTGRRVLTVASIVGRPGVVAFGGVDGTVSVCEWSEGRMLVRDRTSVGPVDDFVALSPSRLLVASGGRTFRHIVLPD